MEPVPSGVALKVKIVAKLPRLYDSGIKPQFREPNEQWYALIEEYPVDVANHADKSYDSPFWPESILAVDVVVWRHVLRVWGVIDKWVPIGRLGS